MDTSDLIIEYSTGDFEGAYRGLLPKGEYWQDTENVELANTIQGIAKDFKQTHDEIELSLLTEFEEQQFGWKISDYQRLLMTMGSNGVVYDEVVTPNLIKINLYSYCNGAAFKALEEKRLPHTEFHWIYPLDAEVKFEQATALTMKPALSSQLEIDAKAQILCRTAMTWQLEIGDTE
ncbi:hypothetical protein [Vibrio crassostreae]|uniref:hypothetical protein n=1 Tax=Vibrio crassostreae TaxID=246167 RepID=UPI001B304C90|nr:hypothetical protein [Vibrio crassostreae]CAK1707053.1 conserved hypothetical protein [Vibrio crassostreae]CAK2384352.1 conserved hypothetical protein [Vibrio crassostreae]CAK2444745.1 conserved hypothetical protein [Vibrio crassostreae]CAK2555781.1 conserved hypothetical protein [Vibrio crassostreae]CAK2562003.1 conserved hypothetical protein [Vibrio crassostreae]